MIKQNVSTGRLLFPFYFFSWSRLAKGTTESFSFPGLLVAFAHGVNSSFLLHFKVAFQFTNKYLL